jgi:hypothetical protein
LEGEFQFHRRKKKYKLWVLGYPSRRRSQFRQDLIRSWSIGEGIGKNWLDSLMGMQKRYPIAMALGQNLNPIGQVVQNGGFYGCNGGGFLKRKQVINQGSNESCRVVLTRLA